MLFRYRLSLVLEVLVWALAMAWLLFLVWDVAKIYRSTGEFAGRSIFELVLLALLVWWPIIRVKLRHGYSMRSWSDAPVTAPDPQARPPQLPTRERL